MSTLTSLIDKKASQIVDQVDGLSQGTAGSLHASASTIRESARQGAKAIETIAGNTARKLDDAGQYVERHELKKALGRSRRFVRQYPAELMVVAAGIGFLSGIVFSRLGSARH